MVWTTIPDSDIDPDSPITTGLMTAYRDNDVEIAEGSSGPLIHPSSALDDTITTEGSQSIGAGATWTTPQGLYNMMGSGSAGSKLELYISGAWRTTGGSQTSGCVFADGTNMRIKSSSAVTETTYWQRFDG